MKSLFSCIAILAIAVLGVSDGYAQTVPFYSEGTDNLYNPFTAEFGGPGITNVLGKSSGGGIAIPSPTSDPFVQDWIGYGQFVGSNGDTIEFSGGGQIFITPLGGGMYTASWVGTFEIGDIDGDGFAGTGRFRNVGPGSQPLDVIAINDPFELDEFGLPIPGDLWSYDYVITGEIDLGQRRRQ